MLWQDLIILMVWEKVRWKHCLFIQEINLLIRLFQKLTNEEEKMSSTIIREYIIRMVK